MRTIKLKIFFLSLLLLNFSIPFAAAFEDDYDLQAYNCTFNLNIPDNKINDLHYDYDVKLDSFQNTGSIVENDTTIFKGLANFEITVNLFTAYSAMDVYNNPELKSGEIPWVTIITAEEYGISLATLIGLLVQPVATLVYTLSESATNDMETVTAGCRYDYWDLTEFNPITRTQDSKLKDIGWAGPLGFDISIEDLTPETLEILDQSGNPITINQISFDSNIVDISVGESETFEIGNYEDYWLNEEDSMGGIQVRDLTDDSYTDDLTFDFSISDLDISSVGDLSGSDIEDEIEAISDGIGVYTDSVEPSTTAYLGCQGVVRPPTQGATLSNGFIDFAIRPHVQPFQQTIHYSNDPVFIFDTESAILQTSAGLYDNSQIWFSEKIRTVGWHVQNSVIQTKLNVVSEIYSTCEIDAKLGGEGDDLEIPDFQLEDMFWNLIFQGDDEAIITFRESSTYTWFSTYGPWIIIALVALVAIYLLGPLIPQAISAGASRSIKKWSER